MAGTTPEVFRIVTLSSGASRGSNLLAIHSYFEERGLPVRIHRAIFCSGKAEAIAKCNDVGIGIEVISSKDMALYEHSICNIVHSNAISLIALCGFMKQLSPELLQRIGVPVLNIHPALLPKYGGKGMYGMNVHRAVFAAGERISGASVHLVDPLYDHGRVLARSEVDVSACLSAEEIAVKVLEQEHLLYAPTIYAELCKT